MPKITVTAKDSTGATVQSTVDYAIMPRVAGGVYFSGNQDIRPKTTNRTPPMNIKGIQQYRSLAAPHQFPGWNKQWITELMTTKGAWLNLISELKHYDTTLGPQTFTVEGKSYTVPLPDGKTQMRPGAAHPAAYSYDQVLRGEIDGLLHRLLASLRTIPAGQRVNVQLASEVDTDNEFGTQSGSTLLTREESDLKAVQAYSYIADWLRKPPSGIAGIPKGVTLSLGYAGQWSGTAGWIRTHPESLMSKMDYLHINSYNHSSNWTPERRFREILTWQGLLGPIAQSKNIIVSEFAQNANYVPNQAGYIEQIPGVITKLNIEQMAKGLGYFVMTLYYASRDPSWGQLVPEEEGLVALTKMMNTPPYV